MKKKKTYEIHEWYCWPSTLRLTLISCKMDRNSNIPSYCNLKSFLTALEVACSCSLCINHDNWMASINVPNLWIYLESVRAGFDVLWHYLCDLVPRVLILRMDGAELSPPRALKNKQKKKKSFQPEANHPVLIWDEGRHINVFNMLQTFSTNWIFLENRLCEKGQLISTHQCFLTSRTYQS